MSTALVRVKDELKCLHFSLKALVEDLAPFSNIEKLRELQLSMAELAEVCAKVISKRSTR